MGVRVWGGVEAAHRCALISQPGLPGRNVLRLHLAFRVPLPASMKQKAGALGKADFDLRTLNTIFSGCLQSVFTKQLALQNLAIA